LESSLLAGYFIVKFIGDTPSIIGYVSMALTDTYVEFHESCLTLGAKYAVMPLYHLWAQKDSFGNIIARSPETRQESWGSKVVLPNYGLYETVQIGDLLGEGSIFHSDASFPPWKVAVAEDIEGTSVPTLGEGSYFWEDSSFGPIGT
jgi:hypothetical protein